MFKLRYNTPPEWAQIVIEQMDAFLVDHAAAEKKASGMAISMLSHYPDRTKLVKAMIDLSIEEMTHFREVVKIMTERGLQLGADEKDPYINAFRKVMRKGSEVYFLDRLLTAGIIEARGCERFGLVGEALPAGKLQEFYQAIAKSEAKHNRLFIDLAAEYFPQAEIDQRMDELLDIEAGIVKSLPLRPALH
ncbi:tRNA-(ms[2]io[6]A)-hydroxylase [Aestuariicella hydrocarbonica]|uniref:tRNA-(Ms[2]io[6]A)-hydroxylase n=1 Tax=Pseudomaricurvus hydrocarbonicus TaxID=1470433 RepID=A0A9E5MM04_9GAMM|nr:tRNA-(ms[2]io[6]A)-hydroxylase [Aestuariicella hydrocarbonica]NHO65135.1 tRNA-(ms[2]io[6]A)-hydroxylase [Aestuariicella hydrocarbonica]